LKQMGNFLKGRGEQERKRDKRTERKTWKRRSESGLDRLIVEGMRKNKIGPGILRRTTCREKGLTLTFKSKSEKKTGCKVARSYECDTGQKG